MAAPTSRSLCGVRLDNGQPLVNGLPSTCFNDVVLVPLASWIFYVALAVWFACWWRATSAQGTRTSLQSYRSSTAVSKARRTGRLTGLILYTALIVASLLMNILEIVRLALVMPTSRGIGLLPFTLASILIVLIVIHLPLATTKLRASASAATLLFWVLSLIFTSVKLRVLALLQRQEPRTGSEYLDSDEILDVGVIVGLYGLFIIVEGIRLVRLLRRGEAGISERATLGSKEETGLQRSSQEFRV